CQQYNSDPRTL
nr:immunoglobulin light chain junction region [Macaca mulatta]